MSAIISHCQKYRYRLERRIQDEGPVYAFFGINPSTADATLDDHTVTKWTGFCKRWGASRFIVGNVFAYRATDVAELAVVADPHGPELTHHLGEIIREADVLVPCWGVISKAPKALHGSFADLAAQLRASGKPVKCFGLSRSGDPLHPLMLAYSTHLVPF